MKKKHIVMIVIAAVIAVSALVVLVIGIGGWWQPAEVTVAGACWSGTRVTAYEWDGPQECPPIELDDDSVPLTIHANVAHSDAPDPIAATRTAIEFINQRLGYQAYALAGGGRPDVLVTIGVAQDDTWDEPGGRARHERGLDGRIYGYVETCNTADISTLNMVLIHELLHILGLGHDDWEGSIMYGTPTSGLHGVPLRQLWISDADVAYLQRYAPQTLH